VKITVWAGGYVGLTGAIHHALQGRDVLIYDPDESVVDAINNGMPKAGEFLGYLGDKVKEVYATGRFRATSSERQALAAERTVHILAVPTERQGHPYDDLVLRLLGNFARDHVHKGMTVLVESTLTPGTIDRFLDLCYELPHVPEIGKNWFLAVCPRRDWFADPNKNMATLDRIVGGVTPACTAKAVKILGPVSGRIHQTDYRTAEITKALENAMLHVPVVFAHQLAWALPEHDIVEALRLAATHWRLMEVYVGAGTGGRCVPLGTGYLTTAAQGRLTFGKSMLSFDRQFRQIIAETVLGRVDPPAPVLVLGIAYRPEFKDAGLSPGLDIAKDLRTLGFDVGVHDPMWSVGELYAMTGFPFVDDLSQHRAIVVTVPHRAYIDMDIKPIEPGTFVLDCYGAWEKHRTQLEEMGVTYARVGRPGWRSSART